MTNYPQCYLCKHYKWKDKDTCKAFPNGIPDDIIFNKHDHTKAFKGDKGIRFEKKVEK